MIRNVRKENNTSTMRRKNGSRYPGRMQSLREISLGPTTHLVEKKIKQTIVFDVSLGLKEARKGLRRYEAFMTSPAEESTFSISLWTQKVHDLYYHEHRYLYSSKRCIL